MTLEANAQKKARFRKIMLFYNNFGSILVLRVRKENVKIKKGEKNMLVAQYVGDNVNVMVVMPSSLRLIPSLG